MPSGFLGIGTVECCSNDHVQFIACYVGFAVLCFIMWDSWMLLPLKLFCTFLHEFGHASAAWLTCSKVNGIEVHVNQGGLTHWSSTRPRCAGFFVMPAGYLGSAFWGGALVVSSYDHTPAVTMAILLCLAMLLTLGYQCFGVHKQPEVTLSILLVCLLLLMVGLICLDILSSWEDREVPLRIVLLFIGVANSIFATWDIYTDCIRSDHPKSDSSRFAESLMCCHGRVIGILWEVVSLIYMVIIFYLTLVLCNKQPIRSTNDVHGVTWLAIVLGISCAVVAVVWRLRCYTAPPRVSMREVESAVAMGRPANRT